MRDYEVIFDAVNEEFSNDMFGEYSNSVTREEFQQRLTSDGWKYFDLKNLNELFSIKCREKMRDGELLVNKIL